MSNVEGRDYGFMKLIEKINIIHPSVIFYNVVPYLEHFKAYFSHKIAQKMINISFCIILFRLSFCIVSFIYRASINK